MKCNGPKRSWLLAILGNKYASNEGSFLLSIFDSRVLYRLCTRLYCCFLLHFRPILKFYLYSCSITHTTFHILQWHVKKNYDTINPAYSIPYLFSYSPSITFIGIISTSYSHHYLQTLLILSLILFLFSMMTFLMWLLSGPLSL